MNVGALRAVVAAVVVAVATGAGAVTTPGVASGATGPVEAFTDTFDGAGALVAPWNNPGGAYQQASGQAFVGSGSGLAWRDTAAVNHQIEVPQYKLDDGGGQNSIGGVTVGFVDANNFVGFEIVKTTANVPNSPESKSVLYIRMGGVDRSIDVQHALPQFQIGDVVSLRLRKEGRHVEAYLNGALEASATLDDAENLALADAKSVGLVNFLGPNNYSAARGDRIEELPNPGPSVSTDTPTVLPPAQDPTTAAPTTAAPPTAAPSTVAPTTATPKPTVKPPPSARTFTDPKNDLRFGADLRRLAVTSGKKIVFTTTHRNLSGKVDVGVNIYVDTVASRTGPEYKVSTVVGRGGKVSVHRVKGWVTKQPVQCAASRKADLDAETVRLTVAPACFGTGSRFRLAAEVTQGGQRDWAPGRRAFYSWVPRSDS